MRSVLNFSDDDGVQTRCTSYGIEPSVNDIAADLQRAREVITSNGWCQGSMRETTGTNVLHCMVGSLAAVNAHTEAMTHLAAHAPERRNVLGCLPMTDLHRITFFNDDDKTTVQDVLEVFDKTLADLGHPVENGE